MYSYPQKDTHMALPSSFTPFAKSRPGAGMPPAKGKGKAAPTPPPAKGKGKGKAPPFGKGKPGKGASVPLHFVKKGAKGQ